MKRALMVLVVQAIGGCATADSIAPAPAPASSVALASDPDQRLRTGQSLFTARCQRCHALPAPTRLSPEAWPAEIVEMSRKAGLSPDQVTLVTEYLVTASRGQRPH